MNSHNDQVQNAEVAGENPVISHETGKGKSFVRKLPGVEVMIGLNDIYGLRFLIMLAICCHWCKGFCLSQVSHGFQYLMGDFQVSGPVLDKYNSAQMMPWAMKPLIALASDAFPVGGFQKLPYLFITALIGAAGILLCLLPIGTLPVTMSVMGVFLGNINWMTCDILAEGIYSRRLAEHPETGPNVVVFVWMGQKMTGIFSAFLAGAMLDGLDGVLGFTGGQWVIGSTLVPTLVVIYPAFMNYFGEEKISPEQCRENRSNLARQPELVGIALFVGSLAIVSSLVNIFVKVYIVSVLMIIGAVIVETTLCATLLRPVIGCLVIYKAIESVTNLAVGGPAYYFYTNGPEQYPEGPHFSSYFYVTVLGVAGNLVAMAALAGYSRWCSEMTYRKIKAMFIIFACVTQLPNSILYSRLNVEWGVPDKVFVLGENVMQYAVSLLYFMPTFLILSRVCPKNVEATLFAILAACSNFAQNGSRTFGGFICRLLSIQPTGAPMESEQFDNMWIANIIMSACKLIPLAFLWLLPPHKQTEVIIPPEENLSATTGSPYRRCTGKDEEPVAVQKHSEP